jgi:hypothetical protein
MLLFKNKKKQSPTVYKNYDAILFLPPAIVSIDKKTKIIEKNGVHVAIMYSETSGVSVMMDLPVDFLKLYYKMTSQVNQGNPSERIVYFAIVHISPQEYARKREKILKMGVKAKRKFFLFPRWIWLILERYNDVSDYFVINKFEDSEPTSYSKEFDTFGAVGITYYDYFIFASVARKDYIASVNKRRSLGLWW